MWITLLLTTSLMMSVRIASGCQPGTQIADKMSTRFNAMGSVDGGGWASETLPGEM
jgi:hypothetical protein